MQETPVEPIKLNQNVPYAVNQIIMKALKKDPNDRYQNASEMIKDLNMALKRPEGGFIDESNYTDGLTRRIPTVDDGFDYNVSSRKPDEKEDEEELSFFQAHKKVIVSGIIALVFLVVFVAALFITLGVANSSGPKDVQIPNVVGKTQEEARIEVENAKLKFNVSKEEFSTEYPEGTVVSQDPAYKSNFSIKEGNTINVVISKGTEMVKMPKVVGEEFSKAESALIALGLKVEKVEEISQKVQAGIVISQENEENSDVQAGSTVKIHVSKGNGKKKFYVTDVVGKDKDEAQKELTELGMEVSFKEKEDTSKSDGVVLEQSISENTEVEEGTKITLTVNKIKQNVQGTVNVKVKSLVATGKYTSEATSEDDETSKEKNVSLKILVGTDPIYDKSVSKDTENVNQTFEGKGNVTIKVYINGILVNGKSYNLDLNSENTVLTVS